MPVYRARVRNLGAAVAASVLLAISASAGAKVIPANVRIDNFGQINHNYYRGAQPDNQGFSDLAALGVRTVIDLQENGPAAEKGIVERNGMHFFRIPMNTSARPSDATVTTFLSLVNDPGNQPVFVHCQGGRHRTGVMTAVYRITADGWTADKAYQEMKQYKFEGFPGHPTLKRFVYDYYTKIASVAPAGERREKAIAANQ